MKVKRLRTTCPFCRAKLDSTTLAIGKDCKPKDGDCTLCFVCGEWMFFAKGVKGGLRKPTWQEYEQLVTRRDAIHVRAAWLHVKQQQELEKDVNEWMDEARRYAEHIYCYPGMVDEFIDDAVAAFSRDDSPYEYVESFGERYDLDRADRDWGIHYGIPFEKRWQRAKVGA